MGLLILAAIIGLPLIEIMVFIQVGSAIGALPTILLTVVTAFAGLVMLRTQGVSLLMRIQSEMNAGRVPGRDMIHGALMVVASVLLLIPGFASDAVGLLLFVPPVRDMIANALVSRAHVVVTTSGPARRSGPSEPVVDLDEGDWQRKPDGASGSARRLDNPWNDDPDRQ
ncbi:FxsA family protein [Roseibium aestuarii]|uniref:FxsA family protein n=1 Tax=Roseibium aestuarii TaxID=2600299 RepID=A0ABW4K348_9HYPH|nr:FxsA family protein [Roseibium aestuarii]